MKRLISLRNVRQIIFIGGIRSLRSISALMTPLAALDVDEFSKLPFIQDAIKIPSKPQSVLSFFYGVDYNDPSYKVVMKDGVQVVGRMNKFWFQGNKQFDCLCHTSFADVIRDAGMGRLPWDESVDGMMAQLLLCDQLSRNAFRGTDESFAYDDRATFIANELMKATISKPPSLMGEFYPPYYIFMITAVMHSENKQTHEEALSFIGSVQEIAPQLNDYWNLCLRLELDHKAVIDRFGRYPHRNKYKGRSNTPEEQEYLNDKDNLPAWAK